VKNGKLFVVSAPSGAGKTTLVHMVCDRIGAQCQLQQVATYTTKMPRNGEQEGIDYHFLSQADFERKIAEGFFIEWSATYGYYYGSPRHILADLEKGLSYIVVVDRSGARSILEQYPDAILIWIYTENIEILANRLKSRKTENKMQITKRLTLAKQEILDERDNSFFEHHVLNNDIEVAFGMIKSIIFKELIESKK
jgi:guanylate kinase